MFSLLRCLLLPSPSSLLAPLNLKSAFSLQRIFRSQIFPCEDWQFDVLVFAVLFAWEMAWDSAIVNIVLQTMKRQLFMSTLVCLETKMRRDVKLPYDFMADTIGYVQVKMRAASLQLARTHARTPLRALRARRDYKLTSLGASRGNTFYNIARVLALYKSYWAAMNKIFIYARPCLNKMTWAFFFNLAAKLSSFKCTFPSL